MSKDLTRDWDFMENTIKYFNLLKSQRAEQNSIRPLNEDSILKKINDYGIFNIAWAFFLWLPMELLPIILSPLTILLNIFFRGKVSTATRGFVDKIIAEKSEHYEPLIAGAVLDAYLLHEMRGYVRNRPSIIVGAAPTPKMKFKGKTYFSIPLIFDEPFDAGSDILLSELVPLTGHPSLRKLLVNSFQRIPMRDGSAGCLVAPHIIDHVPSRKDAVMEAARVLRPGGFFIFTDLSEHFFSLHPIVRLARILHIDKFFLNALRRITTLYLGEGESLEWYKKALDEAGFDLERSGYWISSRIHYYTQIVATFYRLNKSVLIWHSLAMSVPLLRIFLRWAWRALQRPLILIDLAYKNKTGIEIYFVARKRGEPEKNNAGAPDLFSALVSPDTHEPLAVTDNESALITPSGVKYPIVKGIPVLIPELARMYFDAFKDTV